MAELEEQALELRASLQASGELLPGYARSHVVWDELREMLGDRRPLHLGYDSAAMDGGATRAWARILRPDRAMGANCAR